MRTRISCFLRGERESESEREGERDENEKKKLTLFSPLKKKNERTCSASGCWRRRISSAPRPGGDTGSAIQARGFKGCERNCYPFVSERFSFSAFFDLEKKTRPRGKNSTSLFTYPLPSSPSAHHSGPTRPARRPRDGPAPPGHAGLAGLVGRLIGRPPRRPQRSQRPDVYRQILPGALNSESRDFGLPGFARCRVQGPGHEGVHGEGVWVRGRRDRRYLGGLFPVRRVFFSFYF